MPNPGEHHPAFEEYCECIFELREDSVDVIQARIADRLRVSRPSVSEMIRRMTDEGLIASDGTHIVLTAKGEELAVQVVRRHRLAERFLTDILGQAFGGEVVRAKQVMHGKPSAVHHQATGLYDGLAAPFTAARYHSLRVRREDLPPEIEVTAWTEDDVVMGLARRDRPWFGVQFHPESILTPEGPRIVGNFLALA